MKKKKIYLFFMCFSLFFIAACQKKAALKTPLCHVVTEVEIRGREKDVQFYRHYTENEKMEKILIHLRTLNPDPHPIKFPREKPISVLAICVKFSDGKKKFHYQTNHKFISDNYQFCYTFDPAKSARLYQLIRLLPSDDTPAFSRSPLLNI